MSVSRMLASTRRRAAAADIRTHSWIAFMLDQKQPFVLTCTSRRPKPAHAVDSGFHARNDGPFSHVHASPISFLLHSSILHSSFFLKEWNPKVRKSAWHRRDEHHHAIASMPLFFEAGEHREVSP